MPVCSCGGLAPPLWPFAEARNSSVSDSPSPSAPSPRLGGCRGPHSPARVVSLQARCRHAGVRCPGSTRCCGPPLAAAASAGWGGVEDCPRLSCGWLGSVLLPTTDDRRLPSPRVPMLYGLGWRVVPLFVTRLLAVSHVERLRSLPRQCRALGVVRCSTLLAAGDPLGRRLPQRLSLPWRLTTRPGGRLSLLRSNAPCPVAMRPGLRIPFLCEEDSCSDTEDPSIVESCSIAPRHKISLVPLRR